MKTYVNGFRRGWFKQTATIGRLACSSSTRMPAKTRMTVAAAIGVPGLVVDVIAIFDKPIRLLRFVTAIAGVDRVGTQRFTGLGHAGTGFKVVLTGHRLAP